MGGGGVSENGNLPALLPRRLCRGSSFGAPCRALINMEIIQGTRARQLEKHFICCAGANSFCSAAFKGRHDCRQLAPQIDMLNADRQSKYSLEAIAMPQQAGNGRGGGGGVF